jgi:hypothetical protein
VRSLFPAINPSARVSTSDRRLGHLVLLRAVALFVNGSRELVRELFERPELRCAK